MTAPAVRPLFALRQQRPELFFLMEKMASVFVGRAEGYATKEDPYRNFRKCAGAGVDPATGVFIRMGDKFSRVENLIRQGSTTASDGEKIEDNLIDLANYSLICLALLQQSPGRSGCEPNAPIASDLTRDALADAYNRQSHAKRKVWNESRPRTMTEVALAETNIPGFMLEPGEVIEPSSITDEDMDENELRLFIAQAQAVVNEKVRAFSARSEPGDVASITIELKNEGPVADEDETANDSAFRADIRKKFAEILEARDRAESCDHRLRPLPDTHHSPWGSGPVVYFSTGA